MDGMNIKNGHLDLQGIRISEGLPFLLQISVYKSILKYISGQKDSSGSSHNWKQKISRLLETYPSLANEEENEEEGEDSQDVIQSLCENAPDEALFSPSLPEGEEGEEEGGVGVAKGAVQRRRSTRNTSMSRR